MDTTKRDDGKGAVATTAPECECAPTVADDHPDADLLARVAEFYRAFETHNIASEAWHTRHEEAEAMPDCPPHAAPAFDKAGHDRWNAFMKAKGVFKLCDKSNAATRAMGKAVNRVFASPAHTYPGAVEKVKIAYTAAGDGEGSCTGNAELEAYQDIESPWMANAIADLVRLTGATESDSVVTLFAKWGTIQDEATAIIDAGPEPTDEETERLWNAALDRRDVVGDKIMETPATSIKGVAVKVRLASHYAFDVAELAPLHNTPSRDIDYGVEGGAGGALNDHLVSALRDAERLAGVS